MLRGGRWRKKKGGGGYKLKGKGTTGRGRKRADGEEGNRKGGGKESWEVESRGELRRVEGRRRR